MADFGYGSILGGNEIDNLFPDPQEEETEDKDEKKPEAEPQDTEENNEKDKKDDTAETVNPDELFDDDEQPESVGSEKEDNKEKGTSESDDTGASPDNNFYSSIASALSEEGVLPDLDEDAIKGVKSAEDFRDVVQKQIEAGLNETQKRINQALNDGVEPSEIKKYEGLLRQLDSITEDSLTEESEKAEALRKNIIYQDYVNRGYTPQKAQKMTERAIDAGTDIEDAKEALESNKQYFGTQYDMLLKQARANADRAAQERKKQVEEMQKQIMNDKQLFGDIEMDKNLRKKCFDNISKPVYKDPDTGEYYTAIQKYETEHRQDFIKYVGVIYTLTNGFKDFDSFTKGKVKKEVKKGLKNLEKVLNNTKRDSGGNLSFVTSVKDDPESFIGRGIKLDL